MECPARICCIACLIARYILIILQFNSQIEALLEENKQLSKALDLANGTIDMVCANLCLYLFNNFSNCNIYNH